MAKADAPLRLSRLGATANFAYNAPVAIQAFYVATRPMRVIAITARVDVLGTDGSAVTATVKKAPSGTALTSGTALHSSTIDLKGTIATNQVLTLSTTAGVTYLAPGDCIGIDTTGSTTTAAVGAITVQLVPA